MSEWSPDVLYNIAWVMNAFDTLKFLSGYSAITPAFIIQREAQERLEEVLRRTADLFTEEECQELRRLTEQEDYFGALGYLSAIMVKRAQEAGWEEA